MTGFGRGSANREATTVVVELKSVNNKGLDVRARLPREIARAELDAQRAIKAACKRGRFDLNAQITVDATAQARLKLDHEAASALLSELRAFAQASGLEPPARATELLSAPGVVVERDERDDDAAAELFTEALSRALDDLAAARAVEGAHLEKILDDLLTELASLVGHIAARAKGAPDRLRDALNARLADLDADVDPQRLAQEIALLADKADVREEIDRLHAHVAHFRELVAREDAVGRKLDFLCQELNREANTVGSKSHDADTAHLVVELKSCIERLREQVQNVE
jgi:uncharacterized protein (TIGR00255 family)